MSVTIKGLSLIEILVTVLIVNFGVLGLTKLQLSSYEIQNNTILGLKAAFYSESFAQKLTINSDLAKSTNSPYVLNNFTDTPVSTPSSAVCISQSCAMNNLALYDMNTWLYKIKKSFPKGKAKITKTTVGSNALYTISIQWQYKSEVKQYDLLAEI